MRLITSHAMAVFCGLVIAGQTEASQPTGQTSDIQAAPKVIQSIMPQAPNAVEAPQQVGGGGITQFCMPPGMTQQAFYAAVNVTLSRAIGWEPVQVMQTSNNNLMCIVILLKRVSAK